MGAGYESEMKSGELRRLRCVVRIRVYVEVTRGSCQRIHVEIINVTHVVILG